MFDEEHDRIANTFWPDRNPDMSITVIMTCWHRHLLASWREMGNKFLHAAFERKFDAKLA
jgi:hypothetical protein